MEWTVPLHGAGSRNTVFPWRLLLAWTPLRPQTSNLVQGVTSSPGATRLTYRRILRPLSKEWPSLGGDVSDSPSNKAAHRLHRSGSRTCCDSSALAGSRALQYGW